MLQVVSAFHEIDSQPIEKVRIPSVTVHLVVGFDQSMPHEPGPETIDDCPREAAILFGSKDLGQLRLTLFFGQARVDRPELLEEKLDRSGRSRRRVATVDLQWFVGEASRQVMRILEC